MSTPPEARPTLQARGLGLATPDARCLVEQLELQTHAGEVLAVVGPNGSGKSTLLRSLAALRAPQRGDVLLGSSPVAKMPARQRARAIAYLPQAVAAPAELRVDQTVMLGRAPHRPWFGPPTPRDHAAVESALRQCEVQALRERQLHSLSGGERQRVMLARMLATQAQVLILDEPTTALDIGHALRVFELVSERARAGRTVLVAVHELEFARRFADRALCLHGDARGTWTWGRSEEVLTPAILDPVFDVASTLNEGQLSFALPKG